MTPFEDFLFYDSYLNREGRTPAEAVTILHFTGALDFQKLKRAIHETAARHRGAKYPIQLHPDGTLDFASPGEEVLPEVFLVNSEQREFPDWGGVRGTSQENDSILKKSGLRFWVVNFPKEERFRIYFQFHHVVTDALGSFRFLEEVFERYARETDAVFPVDSEFPGDMELNVSQAMKPHMTLKLFVSALWQILSFPFRFTPYEFHTSFPSDDEAAEHTKPLFRTLTCDETRKRLDLAHQKKVSVNDLLLTSSFLAAFRLAKSSASTNSSENKQSSAFFCSSSGIHSLAMFSRPIQIAVPVNIRSEAFFKMPLRNLVSIVFLRASRRFLCHSEEPILRWIHRQMEPKHKKLRANLLLLELKWLCSWRFRKDHRKGMKWFLNRKEPLATLLVSNLGVLFQDSRLPRTEDGRLRVGSAVLDRVEQLSPRTTNAALALAVGTYAGRLHFGLNHDPKRVSEEDALRFLKDL